MELVNGARKGLEETLYLSDVEGDLGHPCMEATSSLDVNGYYIRRLLLESLLPFDHQISDKHLASIHDTNIACRSLARSHSYRRKYSDLFEYSTNLTY